MMGKYRKNCVLNKKTQSHSVRRSEGVGVVDASDRKKLNSKVVVN